MEYFNYLVNLHNDIFKEKWYGVRPNIKNGQVINDLMKSIITKQYLKLDEL